MSSRSFQSKSSTRHKIYLRLAGEIESQLRDAYDKRFHEGLTNQAEMARRLGVNRSAVNRRLTGRTNMTIQTLADLIWALDHGIKVEIYDPTTTPNTNISLQSTNAAPRTHKVVPKTEPAATGVLEFST